MSEKDIKTKPQTTTKSVKNAPKSVEHSAKQAVKDIKTVARDTLVKNAIDKQLDTRQSEQPQRAEVEATEQVENTDYSAVDTVYQKGKSLAENKLKQHRQQVKAKENANTPSTPQADFSEVQNTPKQAVHTPKTKDRYIHSQGKSTADLIKTPNRSKIMPKQNTHTITRNVSAGTKKSVKTKDSLLKGTSKVVKTGNSYVGKSAKKKAVKSAKRAAKMQKEITKKAAKQAAKQAKEVAQKSAQAAKATAKATVKIAVKVAQMVAAATKAVISALAALGGWAVLLVALIVVIVVAAIAASPFGIFISDEAADNDSIPISSIVAECNMELSNKLDDIENAAAADRSEIIGEQANWDLVLAVFATKVAGVEDDTVQDVVVITDDKKQKLKDVFWDMHEITSRTETVANGDTSEKIVYITITTKTKDDMISKYNFTRKQQEALNTLLEQDEVLISATQSLAISDATAQDILKNLPDSLSAERKKVIKAACSLVGKVNYFWGGKSSAIGWDSEWGKLKTVSAEGSKTTGTKRPFGLDCSGFVTWSFINSGFNASSIGHGTKGQIAKCSRISWSSAQAGDLAFYGDLSHVGIVAGKDAAGNILVIHSSSGRNNVVITTNSGFGFAARPSAY